MANSYYNFSTPFVAYTTVKSAPVNTQFNAVATGFASVESKTQQSLKLTGYSSSSGITATPSSFLQLNAAGIPYASPVFGFSPSGGNYRFRDMGNATLGTDGVPYGQMTAYVGTIAFGSPNVLTVPDFVSASALQVVRLNAAKTALEFGNAIAVPPTNDVTSFVAPSDYGTPAWYREGNNICRTPNTWERENAANMLRGTGDQAANYILTSTTGVARATLTRIAQNLNDSAIEVNPLGDFVLSLSALNTSTAGGFRVTIEFKDELGITVSTTFKDFVGLRSAYKRIYLNGFNATGLCSFIVSVHELTGQLGTIQLADLKVESGLAPTPYNSHRAVELLNQQRQALSMERRFLAPSVFVNLYTAPSAAAGSWLYLRGTSSGTQLGDALIRARYGTVNVENDGELDFEAKYVRLGRNAGYAQQYDNGNTGTAKTVDFPTNGAKQKALVTASTTITLTAPPSTIVLDGLRLMLQQNATGGYTTTFTSAATIFWEGGVAPTMATAANARMKVIFFWDGTMFFGSWANI